MSRSCKHPRPLRLGTPVRFSHVLKRENVTVTGVSPEAANQMRWISHPQDGKGLLMGYRTKSHGFVDSMWESEGWEYNGSGYTVTYWSPTGYVRCAIVSIDLYKNPVLVPVESLYEDKGDLAT